MTPEALWTAIIDKIEGKDGAMQKWHDSGVETTKFGSFTASLGIRGADRVQKCFTTNLENIRKITIPLLSFYNDNTDEATWLINQSQHVINIGYIVKTIMPDRTAVKRQQVINITSTQIADIAHVLAFGYSYAEKRFEDLNPQYLQKIKAELVAWSTNRATFNKDNKPKEDYKEDYDKYQIDNYISNVMSLADISAPVPEVLQTYINSILTPVAASLTPVAASLTPVAASLIAKSLVYTTPASSSIFLCDGLPAWLTEPAPVNLSSSSLSSSSSSSLIEESKENYPRQSSSSSSSSSFEESKTSGGFYSEIDVLEEQYAMKVRDFNTVQAELKRIQKEHKQLLKRGSTWSAPGYKKEVIDAVQEYKDLLETIQSEKLAIAKRLSKLKLEQASESATIMKGSRRHTRGSKHHRTRKYVRA